MISVTSSRPSASRMVGPKAWLSISIFSHGAVMSLSPREPCHVAPLGALPQAPLDQRG